MVSDIYKIIIINKQKIIKIPIGVRMLVRRCCNAVIRLEGLSGLVEVNIIFVDNEYIKNLNKQYRGKDYSTDVLSFPRCESGFERNPENGAVLLGDIIISLEQVTKKMFQKEIAFLVVHGMLHLFHYDHERDDISHSIMSEKQERIMELIGFDSIKTD